MPFNFPTPPQPTGSTITNPTNGITYTWNGSYWAGLPVTASNAISAVSASFAQTASRSVSSSFSTSSSLSDNQKFYGVTAQGASSVSIPASYVATRIPFNNLTYDPNIWMSGSGATRDFFKPNRAGFYQINSSVTLYTGANTESTMILQKSGTSVAVQGAIPPTSGCVSAIVYMNGTTDTVSVLISSATAWTLNQNTQLSQFSAAYLGS